MLRDKGEFLTLLAGRLIDDDLYRGVIVVASGISGTPMADWQRNGPSNDMLLRILKDLPPSYRVTQIPWHPGESDVLMATPAADYVAAIRSLPSTQGRGRSCRCHQAIAAPAVTVSGCCGPAGPA